jgi:GT2 family glycosyltransferase
VEDQQLESAPLVSVVVLSYNRPRALRESLACIFRQTYSRLEVLVMDNPSAKSAEIRQIMADFPQATLYMGKSNLGYTGGMNAGVALSRGKYVYLTEDDMYSDSQCIERLVNYAESDSSAGIISGSVYERASQRLNCCGGRVRLGRIYSWLPYNGITKEESIVRGPYCADYTTGAMMLFRRDRFFELGGFRKDFFMYCEDTELCLRSRANGYSVAIVPDAVAFTSEKGNSPSTPKVEYHRFKNFLALYLLHAPMRVAPEFVVRYVALGFVRAVVGSSVRPFLKALTWFTWNTPRILRDRGRRPRLTDASEVRNNWQQQT